MTSCLACDGTGQIVPAFSVDREGHRHEATPVRCSKCSGTGKRRAPNALRVSHPAQVQAIASAEELLAKSDSDLGSQVLILYNAVSILGPAKSIALGRMVRAGGPELLAEYLLLFTKRGRR